MLLELGRILQGVDLNSIPPETVVQLHWIDILKNKRLNTLSTTVGFLAQGKAYKGEEDVPGAPQEGWEFITYEDT